MSIFKKYLSKKLSKSILVFGDIELVLEFEPITVEESKTMSRFATMDSAKVLDEMTKIFAQKCITKVEDQTLIQEDFLGLDIESLSQIALDITIPKKA